MIPAPKIGLYANQKMAVSALHTEGEDIAVYSLGPDRVRVVAFKGQVNLAGIVRVLNARIVFLQATGNIFLQDQLQMFDIAGVTGPQAIAGLKKVTKE